MQANEPSRPRPDREKAAVEHVIVRAVVRLDEALAELEDVRRSPHALRTLDAIGLEALDEAYRRAVEALAWARLAKERASCGA